jgi:hypothetical protein
MTGPARSRRARAPPQSPALAVGKSESRGPEDQAHGCVTHVSVFHRERARWSNHDKEQMMTHLILTEARYAGHCTTGTSNKGWAACLAVEQEGNAHAVDLAMLPATTEVIVLCGHGPYGAALRLEAPKRMTLQAGRALLRKKWQEKTGKGYLSVPFPPFVPSFGAPYGLPLLLPEFPSASTTDPGASLAEGLERENRPRSGNEPPPDLSLSRRPGQSHLL